MPQPIQITSGLGAGQTLRPQPAGPTLPRQASESNLALSLFGPQALGGDLGMLLPLLMGSPAVQAQFRNANLAANAAQSGIASQLGRFGGQNTGIGAVAQGLSSGLLGNLRSQISGQVFGQGLDLTQANLLARLSQFPGLMQLLRTTRGAPGNRFLEALVGGLPGAIGGGAAAAGQALIERNQ